jgi:DNA-binding PadR family transcriptional regulator
VKATHFYILLSLSEEERHGLAIARDVQALCDGRVRLWPATLYGALEELRNQRWIEELSEPPPEESERRRYYRLTRSGRQALAAEAEHMSRLGRLVRSRVGPRAREAR